MDLVNDYEEEIKSLKEVHEKTVKVKSEIIKDCQSDIKYYDNKLKEYDKIPKWIVRLFNYGKG